MILCNNRFSLLSGATVTCTEPVGHDGLCSCICDEKIEYASGGYGMCTLEKGHNGLCLTADEVDQKASNGFGEG